jgi:SAM-dependent methyltransferase
MSIHPSSQPNFDRLARPYRWLEYLTLGRSLERIRLHHLPNLLQQKNALVLGDGDGRFLAHLLAQNLHLHAEAVDISAAMLQQLRRNCEAASPNTQSRLRTHQADARTFPPSDTPPHSYDLVVTHFFLDCLTQPELDSLVARIVPTLTPNALWLISDFRIPSGPMRLPAKLIVRTLYLAFRILTSLRPTHLPNHISPLTRTGLTRISRHHQLFGLLTTELWQLRAEAPDNPAHTQFSDQPHRPSSHQ